MRPSAHPSIGSLKAMLVSIYLINTNNSNFLFSIKGASGSLNAVPGEFYDF